MANKDNQLFDVPDPEAAGWKEDPDRPGYWLWETEQPITEAPEDGKQYGRQDADWTEIVIPPPQWQGDSGGINTNASKVIVGDENTEGAGMYASGAIRVWETGQNANQIWSGFGAGSLTSRIQSNGNAKFTGTVDVGAVGRLGFASFGFNTNQVFPRNSSDLSVSGAVDLGTDAAKWKDGWFGGTVNATSFVGDGSQLTGIDIPEVDLTGYATQTWVTNQGYATTTWVTGQGYATEAWVNGKNYSTYTGADAVKTSGNQTIGGAKTFSSNVTAPDFVATSDRREKKSIVTAPVGIIDQIRGVDFEWKTSGQMGSGVIAQELEEVPELAHLVHESDSGTKHVSYLGLIGYLIEEVKSLKAEIEALK